MVPSTLRIPRKVASGASPTMDQTDKAPSLRIKKKRDLPDIIDQTVDFKEVVGCSKEELPSLEVTLRQGIEAAFSACHSSSRWALHTLVTRVAQRLAIAGQWPYYRDLVIWRVATFKAFTFRNTRCEHDLHAPSFWFDIILPCQADQFAARLLLL
jgi:hypothetical protein